MPRDASDEVGYLVFDVEGAGDGELIARTKYPGEDYSPAEAVARYRAELKTVAKSKGSGSDVIPPSFTMPISIVVAKVAPDYRLLDVSVLDEPEYRPHEMVRRFWAGWKHYGGCPLVTYNGRGYDLPVLELSAFRYGLAIPDWFNLDARSFEQSRNRYNLDSHIDLMDLVSNFGAARSDGGLQLLANLIGKPSKTSLDGSMVQDYYEDGRLDEINDYCRCDVLDTYFVFLRTRVLLGKISLEEEQDRVLGAKRWLESQADETEAYRHYLEHWGKWQPPA